MLQYAQCTECAYIQPLTNKMETYFNCSMCETHNALEGRFLCSLNGQWVAVTYPEINILLSAWDTAIVSLSSGSVEFTDVRLRTCSLHYNEEEQSYRIDYKGVKFKPNEVKIIASWETNNE